MTAFFLFLHPHKRPNHLVAAVFRHNFNQFSLAPGKRTAQPVAHRSGSLPHQRPRSAISNTVLPENTMHGKLERHAGNLPSVVFQLILDVVPQLLLRLPSLFSTLVRVVATLPHQSMN